MCIYLCVCVYLCVCAIKNHTCMTTVTYGNFAKLIMLIYTNLCTNNSLHIVAWRGCIQLPHPQTKKNSKVSISEDANPKSQLSFFPHSTGDLNFSRGTCPSCILHALEDGLGCTQGHLQGTGTTVALQDLPRIASIALQRHSTAGGAE